MRKSLINEVETYVQDRGIPILGAARADELNRRAPEGFRPQDMMPGAKSVLIFAKPLPQAVFQTPVNLDNMFYTRSAYTYYQLMDSVANSVCLMLEGEGFLSLPIPAYSPLRFVEGEPRGLMSLKHAAARAGIGKIGKNTLLIHPEAGNVLRLGGLITALEWPVSEPAETDHICPDGCRRCEDACPVGALKDGEIDKVRCLGTCIKHTMLPPVWMLSFMKGIVGRSRMLTRFMELFSLNFFEIYGIGCAECLKACIHFPGSRAEKHRRKKQG
jgi:epoxyqueuosine reductase